MLAEKRQFQVGNIKSVFDEIIDRHAEAYAEAFPETRNEFSNYEKSGTANYYIGMVWSDENEKPDTTKGLKLRGSLALSKNKMIELDLSLLNSQHSFFPGQVVAFFADPHLKQQLTVRRFLDPMRISPQMKKIDMEAEVNLMIACGPYIKPDSEDWSLFDTMIERIKSKKATHIVLLGPFVDIDNKIISRHYDTNWDLLFDKLVEGLHEHECHVYLVPSNKDVLSSSLCSSYFYPCPEIKFKLYLKENARPKCQIRSVTDPAQIDLGGLFLDVTSAEVLFHLTQCSTFIHRGPGNVFNSMFRHLLSLGIYPIYPPPTDMVVDYPKLAKYIQLDRLGPHILVLPSRFNTPPVSNVDDRLIVTIQKCCVKKQVIFIHIPKIDAKDVELNSVLLSDYKHEIIGLGQMQHTDMD